MYDWCMNVWCKYLWPWCMHVSMMQQILFQMDERTDGQGSYRSWMIDIDTDQADLTISSNSASAAKSSWVFLLRLARIFLPSISKQTQLSENIQGIYQSKTFVGNQMVKYVIIGYHKGRPPGPNHLFFIRTHTRTHTHTHHWCDQLSFLLFYFWGKKDDFVWTRRAPGFE